MIYYPEPSGTSGEAQLIALAIMAVIIGLYYFSRRNK